MRQSVFGGLESWSESVERRSSQAVADAGMELIEVPPAIWPMLRVVRGSCVGQVEGSLEREQGAGEDQDRVGRAGVGPGVAAGAGDGDAEAAAGQGAGDDGGRAAAFQRNGGGDARA